jgi:hypothetical protein
MPFRMEKFTGDENSPRWMLDSPRNLLGSSTASHRTEIPCACIGLNRAPCPYTTNIHITSSAHKHVHDRYTSRCIRYSNSQNRAKKYVGSFDRVIVSRTFT